MSLEKEKAGFCGVAIFEKGHPSDISTRALLSLFNLNPG